MEKFLELREHFLVATVMEKGYYEQQLRGGVSVHPVMLGWSFTTKNCPAFLITFRCPEDIHVNEKSVYNYLSLEPNYILNANTKDCFLLF